MEGEKEEDEKERQETVPLLTRQHDNVVFSSSENGGGRGHDQHATAILVCSTLVSACGAFTYGLVVSRSVKLSILAYA